VTAGPRDPLFDAIEFGILGQDRTHTRHDIGRLSGEHLDRVDALWRALGFTTAGDDERVYTDADVEAVRTFTGLVEVGFVDPSAELALARSMGRSFARLAEWEIGVMSEVLLRDGDSEDLDPEAIKELIARTLPLVEELQDYIWRRHLAAAAGRLMLTPPDTETGSRMAVGFADIVGFTRRSRELSTDELAELVETFEQRTSLIISEHGGRVIKTIGDEVMYAADDPVTAARIALALAAGHDEDESFPEVRVGSAYGDVLSRLGDLFGEVVNIAARLTSLARPGRVVVDRGLAQELEPHADEFRVRRMRNASVKGYSRLECFAVRPPRPDTDDRVLPEPFEDVIDEVIEVIADRLPATDRRRRRSARDSRRAPAGPETLPDDRPEP